MSVNVLAKEAKLYITTSSEPSRELKDELHLDDKGVIGDKFYGKDINRLILITSTDSYKMSRDIGIDIEYGTLGENILLEGSIKSLNLGDNFKIGEVAFEITQNCTLCNGLSKINSKLPKLLKDDRGVFAKAISNGVIKKGDIIYI